jgi:ATP-dependent Lon protease
MFTVTRDDETFEIPDSLPLVPLRDVVFFPSMIYPLLVGRPRSVEALQSAIGADRLVALSCQKTAEVEEPNLNDLFDVGVVARITQILRLPNGTVKAILEGLSRIRLLELDDDGKILNANLEHLPRPTDDSPHVLALERTVRSQFDEYVRSNRRIPDELLSVLGSVQEAERFADLVSAHLLIPPERKQELLESPTLADELTALTETFVSELDILRLEQKIDGQVRSKVQESQREFYLQQQLKAIKEELGEMGEEGVDASEYLRRIEEVKLSEEAREKATEELSKLAKMHPYSAEATVVRSYLDWLLDLPWGVQTPDRTDFGEVQQILDEDHYGLEKVKERILEHLAVITLAKKVRGPILCLVGPPGVGKTSLGKSIARSLGRKFVRMSLGGVRDEAEIRGHRRTYIGSLPGRIVQSMKKAGSMNPVFLLDEVDKMSSDFRGDPASALLEVLDPEQNSTFVDHYLEVEFDLSAVLFVTTANTLYEIPLPLQDRMEIIRLPGYLEPEKVAIARGFLIPKAHEDTGVPESAIRVTPSGLRRAIREYTREAGVRELERHIKKIMRKSATRMLSDAHDYHAASVTKDNLDDYLGVPQYVEPEAERRNLIGVAHGLAWTSAGGDLLPVEVIVMPGKGKLTLTGKLGQVMQESAQAALSYLRARASEYDVLKERFAESDIHVHLPEGAVPKDGPSAGITLAVAMCSAMTQKKVRSDTAMTGELTLRGRVLAVGGLNEKLVAAHRAGIKRVLLPSQNRKDIPELPKQVVDKLELVWVSRLDDVFEHAFRAKPSVRMRRVRTRADDKPRKKRAARDLKTTKQTGTTGRTKKPRRRGEKQQWEHDS